ncbi:PREDICTED: coiled-coil domain-containing protein 108-like [Ceratosolen solmsi marchali]|uniref:Coiled-coil domain-containing protein 108-like n=1 Tax=Ceratosolen solmsi marchali TaxID=326594 RepID=A0AAJ6YK39_9HYME|nr:PREDICTED: coiled-coil domain-containing protein 108-like [Ceratosolen solmsi marchali]
MEYSNESYSNIKCFKLNFGEVEVGVTKIESIKIVNQSNEKQTYVMQRDSISNPLDCVFHIVECTWTLSANESFICDVSYRPILPNRKYIDYFFITDTYQCCCKVIAEGYCIGPKVTSSKSRLIMVHGNEFCKTTQKIKLINHSNISAKFMFDTDLVQCPFKINEISGTIKALSSKCFTISFEPTDVGIYKYHLPCLILDQNPIILELYGLCYYDSDKSYVESFYSKIKNINELDITNNFQNYMSDFTSVIKNNAPAISLSLSYIDFGQAKIGNIHFGKRSSQTVCLSNQNKYDVIVLWEKDTSKTFSIHPQKTKLCSNQSIIFEVRFDPVNMQCAYSKDLIARIFRVPYYITNPQISNDLLMSVIPEFLSIRLIGHTYSNNSYISIYQYEMPKTVTMPACIPSSPVYTTFIIRNFGHQSLLFCFISPTISHYTIKPMAGVINHQKEYQLIAVQLFPEVESDKAYVERWALRLNGNIKNEIYIDFHGYAEEANLSLGGDYSIIFNPVHINCEKRQPVCIRNPTRHRIRFEYLICDFPKELQIEQTNGVLNPNETTFHNFIFRPDKLKNYNFDIRCRLNTEISNKHSIIKIDISGQSTEGFLIAIPEYLNVGEVGYEESCEMKFKIFNFSSVTIHFLLICDFTSSIHIFKNSIIDINVLPSCGTISPGKGKEIKVFLIPRQPGFHDLTIKYFTKTNYLIDNSKSLTESKVLCKLTYTCYLPTLQIKDLLYQAETNKEISKIFLWKSLSIDHFNKALKNLLPLQEITIDMVIPLVTLNEHEKFIVKLLVVNLNPLKASWYFKQKKTCLCKEQTKKKKYLKNQNSDKNCVYCIHDQSFIIYPTNLTLMKNETGILTIIINNILPSYGILWDLNIGEERHIILNIKLETSIILSGPRLKFNNIFIGKSTYMHYQAVWLYNNSEYENIYMIEMKNILLFNKNNYGKIFTCLNPQGIILGYARKPVLFGFRPNKFGKYNITVLVKVGECESMLNIEAESTCVPKQIFDNNQTCPLSDIFSAPEIIIYFSKHCAILPPLSTHGKIIKIFMIQNHHQQNTFYFQWKNYELPGFVKINIEPESGLIQPQSLITFFIKLIIGFYEYSLDIDLFCDFLDVSERRCIEKKKIKKNIIKQVESEFSMTKPGLINPNVASLKTIKKPTRFCKTLTLKMETYYSEIMDQIIDLTQQLQHIPTEEIMSQIFECIIWDIINSQSFQHIIKENLNVVHKLKYSQFSVNIIERKHQLERNNITLSKLYLEDILHTIICMIVHEEFNLGIAHFSHPPDVRQIYEKINTESHDYLTGYK